MTEMVGFRWPVPDGESAAYFAGMLIGRRVRASTVVAGDFTGEVVQAIVVDGGAALWLTDDRAGTKPWKVEQVNSKDSKDWPLPGTRGWGVLTREDVSWLHETGISADPPVVLTRFKDGKP